MNVRTHIIINQYEPRFFGAPYSIQEISEELAIPYRLNS